MTRISIPSQTCQTAHTIAGDVSRLTSTLNGTSTFAALVSAEQARNRAITALRGLGAEIRRLKQDAKRAERETERMRAADMGVLRA